MLAEYENCRVLLVDKKISTARDVIGILEAAIRCGGGRGRRGLGGGSSGGEGGVFWGCWLSFLTLLHLPKNLKFS